ncbi:MAG: hypothetical protein M1812_003031 [Candelaria pacifica]|nr:MAG: hypothetical protein M1812_003031 [Candelaria pacifica]
MVVTSTVPVTSIVTQTLSDLACFNGYCNIHPAGIDFSHYPDITRNDISSDINTICLDVVDHSNLARDNINSDPDHPGIDFSHYPDITRNDISSDINTICLDIVDHSNLARDNINSDPNHPGNDVHRNPDASWIYLHRNANAARFHCHSDADTSRFDSYPGLDPHRQYPGCDAVTTETTTVSGASQTVFATITQTVGSVLSPSNVAASPGASIPVPSAGVITSVVTVAPSVATTVVGGSSVVITIPGSESTLITTILSSAAGAISTAPGGASVIASAITPSSQIVTSTLAFPTQQVTLTSGGTTSITTIPGSTRLITTTLSISGAGTVVSGRQSTYTTVTNLPTPVICPKLFVNPTYKPAAQLPPDYTWGCPPGYLCEPLKENGCNINEAPPDRGYVCDPSRCLPVAPLNPNPPQTWGEPVVSNTTDKYYLQDDYFNLNPRNFDLDFDIFQQQVVVVVNLPSKARIRRGPKGRLAKRATTAPRACYDDCNAPMLEAQSTGKTPALCQEGSAFTAGVSDCQTCISGKQGSKSSAYSDQAQPDFQQFLDYCSGSSVQTPAVQSVAVAQSQVVAGSDTTVVATAVAAAAANTGSASVISSSAASAAPPPSSTATPSTSTSISTTVVSTSVATATSTLVLSTSTTTLAPSAPTTAPSTSPASSAVSRTTAVASSSANPLSASTAVVVVSSTPTPAVVTPTSSVVVGPVTGASTSAAGSATSTGPSVAAVTTAAAGKGVGLPTLLSGIALLGLWTLAFLII